MSRIFQSARNLLESVRIWIERNQKLMRGWLELEGGISYRFPVVESVIVTTLFVTIIATLTGSLRFWGLTIYPVDVDITQFIVISKTDIFDVYPILSIPSSLVFLLIFLVPMVVSYTTARGFENGTVKTLLSYPISRFQFLFLKITLGIVVLGTISTMSIMFASCITGQLTTQLSVLFAIIVGVWILIIFIVSVTTLFAIIIKNSIGASFLGSGIFFLALLSYVQIGMTLSQYSHSSYMIKGILNPLLLVNEYFIGIYFNPIISPSFQDVMVSIVSCLFISFLLFILAWKIFDYSEVK